MKVRISALLNPLRTAKHRIFVDRYAYHSIKFGIAAGMSMPINRHRNLRPELGLYEIGIARHFVRLTRGVQVGYDLGSALGYYVLAMRKQGIASVYAFEPDNSRALSLQETLRHNGIREGVQILNCFIGDRSEGGVSSIDDLVRTGCIQAPGLVKIDIDGEEVRALLGMRDTVDACRPAFIIEVHSVTLEQDCIRFLRAAGYDQIHIVGNGAIMNCFLPEERPIELNRWVVAWCSANTSRLSVVNNIAES